MKTFNFTTIPDPPLNTGASIIITPQFDGMVKLVGLTAAITVDAAATDRLQCFITKVGTTDQVIMIESGLITVGAGARGAYASAYIGNHPNWEGAAMSENQVLTLNLPDIWWDTKFEALLQGRSNLMSFKYVGAWVRYEKVS